MNLRDADNGKILWQSNDDMYVSARACVSYFNSLFISGGSWQMYQLLAINRLRVTVHFAPLILLLYYSYSIIFTAQ